MKINNNNQQNLTFKKNTIVCFPRLVQNDLKPLAREFAVTDKKIAKGQVGLTFLLSNLRVLVLDKTTEIAGKLFHAYRKLTRISQDIMDMKESKMFDTFSQGEKDYFLKEEHDAQTEFNRIFNAIQHDKENTATIHYPR